MVAGPDINSYLSIYEIQQLGELKPIARSPLIEKIIDPIYFEDLQLSYSFHRYQKFKFVITRKDHETGRETRYAESDHELSGMLFNVDSENQIKLEMISCKEESRIGILIFYDTKIVQEDISYRIGLSTQMISNNVRFENKHTALVLHRYRGKMKDLPETPKFSNLKHSSLKLLGKTDYVDHRRQDQFPHVEVRTSSFENYRDDTPLIVQFWSRPALSKKLVSQSSSELVCSGLFLMKDILGKVDSTYNNLEDLEEMSEDNSSFNSSQKGILDSQPSRNNKVPTQTTLFTTIQKHRKQNLGFTVYCKNNKFFGNIAIKEVIEKVHPTFLHLIKQGLSIDPFFVVDFTASNGDPRMRYSLHYQRTGTNVYMKSLIELGTILQTYSRQRRLYLYGMGAKNRKLGHSAVSQCFALNGKQDTPFVSNTKKILKYYNRAVNNSELLGPTKLGPSLEECLDRVVENLKEDSNYYGIIILMVDDDAEDRNATLEAIERAHELPVSIIFVGVGESPFKQRGLFEAQSVKKMMIERGWEKPRDFSFFMLARDCKEEMWSISGTALRNITAHIVEFFTRTL